MINFVWIAGWGAVFMALIRYPVDYILLVIRWVSEGRIEEDVPAHLLPTCANDWTRLWEVMRRRFPLLPVKPDPRVLAHTVGDMSRRLEIAEGCPEL